MLQLVVVGLGERGDGRVVVDEHRHAEPLAEHLAQRHVGERHVDRGDHPAGVELDDRRHPDADRVELVVSDCASIDRDELIDQRLGRSRARSARSASRSRSRSAQRRRRDLGPAEVDADDVVTAPASFAAARMVEQHGELFGDRGTSDEGTCGSGLASGPNAAATASALEAPATRNTTCRGQRQRGQASCVTRGTNGSSPASGPPTTSRERSDSVAWSGNSEARVAVGADPEQHQIELRRAGPVQLRARSPRRRPRVRARP